MAPGLLIERPTAVPTPQRTVLEDLSPLKLVAAHFRDAAVSLPPEPSSQVPLRWGTRPCDGKLLFLSAVKVS